jgi:hypothetical protein
MYSWISSPVCLLGGGQNSCSTLNALIAWRQRCPSPKYYLWPIYTILCKQPTYSTSISSMHIGHLQYPLICCLETNPSTKNSCTFQKMIHHNTKFLILIAFDVSIARTPSQSFCKSRMRGRMNTLKAFLEGLFSPATVRNACQCALNV